MKQVLMVTRPIAPPWDEASKNFAYSLARGIKRFHATMITPGHVPSLDKHIRQLPLYTDNHLSMKQKIRLARLLALRNDFDIVHFMLTPNRLNSYTGSLLFKGGRTKTIQTVATLRDDLYDEATLKKILFADAIVTYSDYAKNKLERLGFTNVTRIYPGIDFSYYKPVAKKNKEMCERYGITEKDFVVTYPGEYVRLGVTDQLAGLLPGLIRRIPNLKFIFACRIKNDKDARKKRSLQNHFSRNGLSKHIVYTDTVQDMAKLYNLSDVILFPVKSMAGKFDVPLSIIEAMACAKPVVVTDLPVLSEFTNTGNAVVIPCDDAQALTDKIEELYKSPEMRQHIGDRARKYVTANFDVAASRKEYEKIYDDLTK